MDAYIVEHVRYGGVVLPASDRRDNNLRPSPRKASGLDLPPIWQGAYGCQPRLLPQAQVEVTSGASDWKPKHPTRLSALQTEFRSVWRDLPRSRLDFGAPGKTSGASDWISKRPARLPALQIGTWSLR